MRITRTGEIGFDHRIRSFRRAVRERPLFAHLRRLSEVSNREEFRTPLGVGKSPRNEPAVCRAGLWGFDVLVVPGRAVVKRAALHRMRIRSAFPGDHDRDPGALVGVFDDGGKDQRK
jgi:hypothetical protein